jgi:hypothetical protein
MMLKVTLKFSFYCVIMLFWGCSGQDNKPTGFEIQRMKDSISEARIDSANAAIKTQCDTLMVYQVPKMVDSLLKDSALLQQFFNNAALYNDADEKVEKVVRQLQADCDSNLLKETYRIARLRQKPKPKQHPKRKV